MKSITKELIIIKNYYDQQLELNSAKFRLKTLEEKREFYFNATQPQSVAIKETVVSSSTHSDLLANYVIKIEEIDKEIEVLKKEIEVLEKYLNKMEGCLRKMKGSLERIFVAKYIDGLKVNQIARRINYSPSHIYRELSIINKIIKDDKK